MVHKNHIICEQCDLVLDLPKITGHYVGVCPRCHNSLYHFHPQPVIYSLCYAITTLIFMFAMDFLPFIGISSSGLSNNVDVLDYTQVLSSENMSIVSLAVYFFMQILPFIALSTIIITDICYLSKTKFFHIKYLLKLYRFCLDWSMVEVFTVAVLVSLIKLVNLVEINYGYGFYCLIIFSFFYMLSITRYNLNEMWTFFCGSPEIVRKIQIGISAESQNFARCQVCGSIVDGEYNNGLCERCGSKIKDKSKHSINKCLALVVAAICMYVPANIYPMMVTTYFGVNEPSTIIDGVIVLWQMKSYFVAIVILVASICIPILKIVTLLYLCVMAKKIRKAKNKVQISFLYRLVEFIGKWSMVDVFVVAIMATIVRIGNFMVIYPGSAVFSFGIVVVLTMLAARQFDPRLLWGKI